MLYRFAFEVAFDSDEAREAYISAWQEGSAIIQTYPGARGTKLHSKLGSNAVFAVAEWESKSARDSAFDSIRLDHPDEADRILGENGFDEQFGIVTVFGGGDEIAVILPPEANP